MTAEYPSHFKGKDAIGHVAEAHAQGIIDSAEIHGTETPGHISAAADAARETALMLALLWIILLYFNVPQSAIAATLLIFTGGMLFWKAGRSAWLGWSRLERLHRVIAQEKWEIEHNRPQERDELRVLYAAKGFEGKLLEDVLDVLMADGDRLLRVMVEEELGLTLESHDHPLKQSVGAVVGVLFAALIFALCYIIHPALGPLFGSLLSMGCSGLVGAYHSQNRQIPAFVWNVGLGVLPIGFVYFMLNLFSP